MVLADVDLVGAALLVTALAGAFTSVVTVLTARRVGKVHDEVKTMNGQTMGVLADRVEGRRIEAVTPEAERTPNEQHYVDKVTTPTDAEVAKGEQPPK